MSYYTRFADVETSITTGTTSILAGADVMLVFSNTDNKYHKATVTSLGATLVQTGTVSGYTPLATSTATQVYAAVPQTIVWNNQAVSALYALSTPAVAGIVINFVNTSTTSTNTSVMTESSGSAPIFGANSGAGGGQTMAFTGSVSNQSASLVSGFSSSGAAGGGWLLRSYTTGTICT